MGIVEVRVEDLLGKGEGAVESRPHDCEVLRHLLVVDEAVLLEVVLPDLHSRDVVSDGAARRAPLVTRREHTFLSSGESVKVAMRRKPRLAQPRARLRATPRS
jgi:hypothetical protein